MGAGHNDCAPPPSLFFNPPPNGGFFKTTSILMKRDIMKLTYYWRGQMATQSKKKEINKNKLKMYWGGGILVALIVLIAVFGTPSAESVFKDMNDKMLQVKSVTIDQKLTMEDTAEINTRIYMDLNSKTKLLAKGNFALEMVSNGSPLTFVGDLIKFADSGYVKYSEISSSDANLSASLASTESMLKNHWIKIRDNDQFASIANSPLGLTANVLPIPYANLNDTERKAVLAIIQDKDMYTINESSKVDVAGVSAYKYLLTFDDDQYKKAATAIAGYVNYFKSSDSDNSSEINSLTVWVDINTKRLIKVEYTGTTESGEVTGKMSFSGYDKSQTVQKPEDYFIESELLN